MRIEITPDQTNPRLIVHRSADQIGGNCIEIAYDGHRLILDAGSTLDESPELSHSIPPSLDTTSSVDGVIVSHPHQDHYGLLRKLPEHWPVWCGEPTAALMHLTVGLSAGKLPQIIRTFRSFKPFCIGPFTVTPFLTDHSAFDAHMILVDVGGRRILYSGDFRRTGRKSMLVKRMITTPPENVDVLLLEGTTLGRSDGFPTESDLESKFIEVFNATPGRVFVTWSAQNIDRTVTIYRACKQTGRTLVVDLYSADVLERLGASRESLPRLGWPRLRGVATSRINWLYENKIKDSSFFSRCCKSGVVFKADKIETGPRSNVIMLRPSLFSDYLKKGLRLTREDSWIFSMWAGYLKQEDYLELGSAFEKAGAQTARIHTSGHASLKDLREFAGSINARHVVPIHSFDWDRHIHGFMNVTRLHDGEVFEI